MSETELPVDDASYRAALQWFEDNAGQEVGWPQPVAGIHLANKAKGIHKPQGHDYALSIRNSLTGPYEDGLEWSPEGVWLLKYAYEGKDRNYFTNRALRACLTDGVPLGVMIQVKKSPGTRYKVLGLGSVVEEVNGAFIVHQYGTGGRRAEVAVDVSQSSSVFDASSIQDGRLRTLRSIALRRGQPAFRKSLMSAYGGICAITGCAVSSVLEAAHIIPYLGDDTNHVQNGLLLRADIHTLFDLGLVTIEPETYIVRVSPELSDSGYWEHEGKALQVPTSKHEWPSKEALAQRAAMINW